MYLTDSTKITAKAWTCLAMTDVNEYTTFEVIGKNYVINLGTH